MAIQNCRRVFWTHNIDLAKTKKNNVVSTIMTTGPIQKKNVSNSIKIYIIKYCYALRESILFTLNKGEC